MNRRSLSTLLLLLSSLLYGQNKKEQIQLQQQIIDSLKSALDSAETNLTIYHTRVLELDAVIDRKEHAAIKEQERTDSLKLRSLQLEKQLAQMAQREEERRKPPVVVDVSSVPACRSYLKNRLFVAEHWDGDLYLSFDQNGTVSVTKEQCGEWDRKKLPELGGSLEIDLDMGLVKTVRRFHFGPNQEAILLGDGTLIWTYDGSNYFMIPESTLLSLPDKTIEIDGIYLDAGGNDDVGEKLMFMIRSNVGHLRYVLEDATHTGPNPKASQALYLDLGDGMPPSYAPNPSMIGQRFILTIARGESYPDDSDPQPYPADHIVDIRAINP